MEHELIKKAVKPFGTVAAFARAIGVEPPTVHQWISRERPVPAKQCPIIEEKTGGAVTRYELRRDVFGDAPKRARAA